MAIRKALVAAGVLLMLTTGVVVATHTSVGLSSELLGRGTWAREARTEFLSALAAQGRLTQSDVAVVKASLTPGGTTDWHGHPGPSVVVVTAGTVRTLEPTANGGCTVRDYSAGEAFFHTAANHNFTNPGDATAHFLVTYFAPAGGLLVHHPDPETC